MLKIPPNTAGVKPSEGSWVRVVGRICMAWFHGKQLPYGQPAIAGWNLAVAVDGIAVLPETIETAGSQPAILKDTSRKGDCLRFRAFCHSQNHRYQGLLKACGQVAGRLMG